MVGADHCDLATIGRNRGLGTVLVSSGQWPTLVALGGGSGREPKLAHEIAVVIVVVLRIQDPARSQGDRLDVAACVVMGVGPQPGLADRAAGWHLPDRKRDVVAELWLVVAHPDTGLVRAEAWVEGPMHGGDVVIRPHCVVVRHLPPLLSKTCK